MQCDRHGVLLTNKSRIHVAVKDWQATRSVVGGTRGPEVVENQRTSTYDRIERQQVVRVDRFVKASHVVQRNHERLSLIQWIVGFSSPVCSRTDMRSDSY